LRISTCAVLTLALCSFGVRVAEAQMTWTDKLFINANIGIQGGSHSLESSTNFDLYDETGTFSISEDVGGGFLFDVSAGYKVWRNLAVGIGFTRVASDDDLTINALVPDPVDFDRPRSVTVTAPDASHSETAINLSGTWMVPVTDKVDVGVVFGPTIFHVSQDLPTSISVTEPGPTINSTSLTGTGKTTMGFHAGVDVTYLITPRVGVGGLARYTVGSVDFDEASDNLTVGGFQLGAGVRIRF
jgi:hypothetical protein